MIIAVTSYRGGCGKSLISLNLAIKLAATHNTLLLEADFLAPSFVHVLPELRPDYSWNDYLIGNSDQKQVMQKLQLAGHSLDVVCTKPNDSNLFKRIQDKNSWKGEFFDRINRFLSEQRKVRDFIIIDNQSGTFLSTATHAFFSDSLICIARPDRTDMPGTYNYLDMLKKNFYIVWNQSLDVIDMDKIIEKWNSVFFARLPNYKGSLGKIPFDEKTAYQRWIKGQAIIQTTPFATEIGKIVEQIKTIQGSGN
ncbi:MAG: tyrosine-protein kinase family protein [Candidatus Odinarchaeota archaeon]